ncbi:MAG: hypothetical protein QM811_31385 [Pirellulales bacterium]
MVRSMIARSDEFSKLVRLECPGCGLTDADVLAFKAFPNLRHLDLSDNPITNHALTIVERLSALETLNLDGTQTGWWAKRGVNSTLERRREAKPLLPTY